MLPGRNCPGNPAEELQSPALAQILVTQAQAMMLVRLVVPRPARRLWRYPLLFKWKRGMPVLRLHNRFELFRRIADHHLGIFVVQSDPLNHLRQHVSRDNIDRLGVWLVRGTLEAHVVPLGGIHRHQLYFFRILLNDRVGSIGRVRGDRL